VFTCEHASNELPEWTLDPQDAPLVADHWGWDIGAADLTRALVELTGSCAVLSRFSRLVCDPNRDPGEPSFILAEIDGQVLALNARVDAAERLRRQQRYFDPYHDAIDHAIDARKRVGTAVHLCSIHSFTPVYLGRRRAMEIGVLFDDHDAHAWRLQGALAEQGFETALNAPYSGRDGLTYAARRHGRKSELVYLELEVRQDLIDTPQKAGAVADRVARALEFYRPPAEAPRSKTGRVRRDGAVQGGSGGRDA
jgi:predicted N-formylglutamate amidohydrolase